MKSQYMVFTRKQSRSRLSCSLDAGNFSLKGLLLTVSGQLTKKLAQYIQSHHLMYFSGFFFKIQFHYCVK